MVEEDKTYENEVKKEEPKEPNHGGKRPGAGRPLVLRLQSYGNLWKKWQLNTNILL